MSIGDAGNVRGTMLGSGSAEQQAEVQRVLGQFHEMRQEIHSLAIKVSELEMEKHEHACVPLQRAVRTAARCRRVRQPREGAVRCVRVRRVVMQTLEPLAADRRCYRMIGGVLVERTVGDVLPAVKQNADGVRSRPALAWGPAAALSPRPVRGDACSGRVQGGRAATQAVHSAQHDVGSPWGVQRDADSPGRAQLTLI